MVMEGKWLEVEKEEKRDLLPVIWSVAPESRTQEPRELEWVSPAQKIPVCATDTVEQEFWRSSYHLRNSLKITGGLEVSDKVISIVDGGSGVAWTTATVEEATTVVAEESMEEREKKRENSNMLRSK